MWRSWRSIRWLLMKVRWFDVIEFKEIMDRSLKDIVWVIWFKFKNLTFRHQKVNQNQVFCRFWEILIKRHQNSLQNEIAMLQQWSSCLVHILLEFHLIESSEIKSTDRFEQKFHLEMFKQHLFQSSQDFNHLQLNFFNSLSHYLQDNINIKCLKSQNVFHNNKFWNLKLTFNF